MALGALVDAARDAVMEGSTGQHFAVEVRTELAVFSKSRPFSIPGFSASNDNAASVAASFT